MGQGNVLNPNFRDYKVTRTNQMPPYQNIKSIIVAVPHEEGPYGAKGLGEAVLTPVAPAIGNAIHNAIYVRMHDLPITQEKLLASFRAKRERSYRHTQ